MTINAFLKNKNNLNAIKWVLHIIKAGSLNDVPGFADLDSSHKNLISIYKGGIVKAARAAGYTQTGKELADLVAQKIMQKKAENAEMKGTIHETLFGKTADADS